MWTVFYESNSSRYKVILYWEYYLNVAGKMYACYFENRDGRCLVGELESTQSYVIHYSGDPKYNDYDSYYAPFRNLGWGKDLVDGISDSDPRVKKILSEPKIAEVLHDYLIKNSHQITRDVFTEFIV